MAPDEISTWSDGTGAHDDGTLDSLGDNRIGKEELWVVRSLDVAHASKHCLFGTTCKRGGITHTNLTGGGDTYVGGRLISLDENTVAINGDSGRYGIRPSFHAVLACRENGASNRHPNRR